MIVTVSGVYDSLFTNISGCDSLVILILRLIHPIQQLHRKHVTPIHGLAQHTQMSGIYDSLFTNSSGCDSLVVLDLTINTSDTTTTQEIACDTYTWLGSYIHSERSL